MACGEGVVLGVFQAAGEIGHGRNLSLLHPRAGLGQCLEGKGFLVGAPYEDGTR